MSRSAEPGSRLALNTLFYKKKTSEMLRARLSGGEQQIFESKAYQVVVSMMITAVFEDALEEAAVHVKMLKHVLSDHSSRRGKEVDLRTLYTIVWYDFIRTCKGLTRPLFDFLGWVPDQFSSEWQEAMRCLPSLSSQAESNLDKSSIDEDLHELFIGIREILEFLDLVTFDPSITNMPTQVAIAQWMTIWLGQLLNRYLDTMSALDAGSELHADPVAWFMYSWSSYTRAYTCLAGLWWTRCFGKMENPPTGPALTVLNSNIIPALKTALIQSEQLSDGLDSLINSRVRLWALYVGALAEQRAWRVFKTRRPGVRSEYSWFTDELLSHARTIDLLTWSDV
jgi:hypothetical protein